MGRFFVESDMDRLESVVDKGIAAVADAGCLDGVHWFGKSSEHWDE